MMPFLILHPVPPLPPLPTYFALSFLFLLWSVLQAREDLSIQESNDQLASTVAADMEFTNSVQQTLNLTQFFDIHQDDTLVLKYVKSMVRDSWSVLVLCNVAFCFLLIAGMLLQWLIFGKLRDSERQHVRDKLWNFAFYKFIVVFGVLNVQTLEEMIFWVGWFSLFAFLQAFTQLSKDRFEYLSFSPATSNYMHSKVLGLLTSILLTAVTLGVLCIYMGRAQGWNLLLFMMAECLLLAFRSLHVIMKYGIHLYDLHYQGVWEHRGMVVYYTELSMELLVLAVDLMHHAHMLLWGNVFLSMASLVICLQIRFLYNEIQRRIQRHRNYRKVVNNMEARFSNATEEELRENDDDCAICWEEMKSARKLPCNHYFHDGCLRSWLEHETSCPTCRHPLNIARPAGQPQPGRAPGAPPTPQQRPGVPVRNIRRVRRGGHFFHFDGSSIASWMPSFSVEVTHAPHMRRMQIVNTSAQFSHMANQVVQMFPDMSYNTILNDLRHTRSVEVTVGNIVDGRLVEPLPANPATVAPTNPPGSGPPVIPTEFGPPSNPPGPGGDTYSPLLTRPADTGIMRTDRGSVVDQPSASSAWHQVPSAPDLPVAATQDVEDGTDVDAPRGFSPASNAARFSKSSSERESMLKLRKERLLQEARRKYAASQTAQPTRGRAPSVSDIDSNASGNMVGSRAGGDLIGREMTAGASSSYNTNSNPLGGGDDVLMRRNAVLEATLRRLNQSQ